MNAGVTIWYGDAPCVAMEAEPNADVNDLLFLSFLLSLISKL